MSEKKWVTISFMLPSRAANSFACCDETTRRWSRSLLLAASNTTIFESAWSRSSESHFLDELKDSRGKLFVLNACMSHAYLCWLYRKLVARQQPHGNTHLWSHGISPDRRYPISAPSLFFRLSEKMYTVICVSSRCDFSYLHASSGEFYTYSWLWLQAKFIPGESGKQVRFANSGVTNQDDFKEVIVTENIFNRKNTYQEMITYSSESLKADILQKLASFS